MTFEGNKTNCFPKDQYLSNCYIAGNLEAGNSINLASCNGGRRSTFVLLLSDVIDFCNVARSVILAGNSFIVRCESRDLEVTNESPRCWKKFPAI